MIHHVDRAFESFLRQYVPLPEASVDVSFRAPEGSWTASVARPTVDAFLWDVARAEQSSGTGIDQRVSDQGRRQQRPLPTQIAFRYFLTVWTRDERDEHELLGAILRCALRHDVVPSTLLPPVVAETICRLVLGGDQHRLPAQLWSGAPVKPGLYLEVILGVDAIGWMDRGTPVEEMHITAFDKVARPLATVSEAGEAPPIRRFRSGAALVMEGRPAPLAEAPASREGGPEEGPEEDGQP